MKANYKKLWIKLLEKDMQRQTLIQKTGMSSSTLSKMAKGKNVNTDVLVKICEVLDCDIGDIMSIIPDPEDKKETE